MIEIVDHSAPLARSVIDLILDIQRNEFGLDVHAADQPDLLDVAGFYQGGSGNFWVALDSTDVVGTLGLRDIGAGQGALRKMYVKATHRGRQHAVAARLLDHLLRQAAGGGMQHLYLGTTEQFAAACRFYEKNGFIPVTSEDLPAAFPRLAPETRFYHRVLS